MTDEHEREALQRLTTSECQVLYWICQGLPCKAIAQKLVIAERTVYFHLANIYEKLEIQHLSRSQRRLILGQLYCPILREQVADPEHDCLRRRQPDKEPPTEPPEETLAIVKKDEELGIIPIQRALMVVEDTPIQRPEPDIIVIKPPPPDRGRTPRRFPALAIIALALVVIVVAWVLNQVDETNGNRTASAPTATRAFATSTSWLASTSTPEPASTNTREPTQRPTATRTATTEPAWGRVNAQSLNVRSGPSTDYSVITQVRNGTRVDIIGTNTSRTWWQVRLSDGTTGWAHIDYIAASGCLDCVGLASAPALPTATLRPPQVQLALPFEDKFDGGMRPEWQTMFGTWRMVNNMMKADPNDDVMSWILVGDEGWTDYAVDVDVREDRLGCGDKVRIIVRAYRGSYMALDVNDCNTDWILVSEGGERPVAHSDQGGIIGRVYEWHTTHLRVEAKGDTYTAYANGNLLLRVQDGTLGYGRAGIGVQTGYKEIPLFDSFRVAALP